MYANATSLTEMRPRCDYSYMYVFGKCTTFGSTPPHTRVQYVMLHRIQRHTRARWHAWSVASVVNILCAHAARARGKARLVVPLVAVRRENKCKRKRAPTTLAVWLAGSLAFGEEKGGDCRYTLPLSVLSVIMVVVVAYYAMSAQGKCEVTAAGYKT